VRGKGSRREGDERPARPDDDVAAGPAIVVYTLAHTVGALRAAARTGRPVTLTSATDAGIYAGPGWFGAVLEAAREAVPKAVFSALLDCGDQPGAALAAIRAQVESVIFTGRGDVARRLADIAAQHGVRLVTGRPTARLDLGDDFFAAETAIEQRCADFLASLGA
jgi:delta 1-pyrroline-5-carboxylate dehydrogenase